MINRKLYVLLHSFLATSREPPERHLTKIKSFYGFVVEKAFAKA
ncbi:MAG: hypothetical protein ABNH00_04590 [Dokdonia sp.]